MKMQRHPIKSPETLGSCQEQCVKACESNNDTKAAAKCIDIVADSLSYICVVRTTDKYLLVPLMPNLANLPQAPDTQQCRDNHASKAVPKRGSIPFHQCLLTLLVRVIRVVGHAAGNHCHQCQANSFANLADRVEHATCQSLCSRRKDRCDQQI
jgi:hypothetical protein